MEEPKRKLEEKPNNIEELEVEEKPKLRNKSPQTNSSDISILPEDLMDQCFRIFSSTPKSCNRKSNEINKGLHDSCSLNDLVTDAKSDNAPLVELLKDLHISKNTPKSRKQVNHLRCSTSEEEIQSIKRRLPRTAKKNKIYTPLKFDFESPLLRKSISAENIPSEEDDPSFFLPAKGTTSKKTKKKKNLDDTLVLYCLDNKPQNGKTTAKKLFNRKSDYLGDDFELLESAEDKSIELQPSPASIINSIRSAKKK